MSTAILPELFRAAEVDKIRQDAHVAACVGFLEEVKRVLQHQSFESRPTPGQRLDLQLAWDHLYRLHGLRSPSYASQREVVYRAEIPQLVWDSRLGLYLRMALRDPSCEERTQFTASDGGLYLHTKGEHDYVCYVLQAFLQVHPARPQPEIILLHRTVHSFLDFGFTVVHVDGWQVWQRLAYLQHLEQEVLPAIRGSYGRSPG